MSEHPQISEAAMRLLRELAIVPESAGYDHRIAELDKARLIEWLPGWGYGASAAGIAHIAAASEPTP